MYKLGNPTKRLNMRNDLKNADYVNNDDNNACIKNNYYNFKKGINLMIKKIFRPRTYRYEKRILKDYYLKFDYQNHFINQKLLVKHFEISESETNEMYKKQEKNKHSTDSKYTYDNVTYMHSPNSKSKQQFKISSSTTPFVNSFINRLEVNSNTNGSEFQQQKYQIPFSKVNKPIYFGDNLLTTALDKSIISNQQYFCNNNDASFIDRNLPTNEIDLKIKEKFYKMKTVYPKSMYLTQLLMIESMYNVKMSNTQYELKEQLEQFEQLNIERDVNYKRVSRRTPKRSNSINNFAQAICSCSHLRRRKSASRERIATSSTEYLNKNLITLPISATSLNNINELIQHKNYFKLERENLEIRYDNIIQLLQSEILNRINELQIKMNVEQRLLNFERANMMEKMKERESGQKQYQQRSQIISSETSIERKIRKRQRTICSNYLINNKQAFNQISTSNQQLNAIKFYRNINVKETSV
jgi:hypothetical protein